MKLDNRVFARHVAESAMALKNTRELSLDDMQKVSGGDAKPSANTNVFTYNCNGCGGGKHDQLDA